MSEKYVSEKRLKELQLKYAPATESDDPEGMYASGKYDAIQDLRKEVQPINGVTRERLEEVLFKLLNDFKDCPSWAGARAYMLRDLISECSPIGEQKTCVWTEKEYNSDTSCGYSVYAKEGEFCPHCGKPIVVKE